MAEEKQSLFYKSPKYGSIHYNEMMETPRGRLVYPNLTRKGKFGNHSITIVFDVDNADVKAGLIKLQNVGKALLAEAGTAAKGHKYPTLKKGVEGDHDALVDKFYIACKADTLPPLIDVNNNPLPPEAFLAGMIVRAVVKMTFFPANGAGISYKFAALRLVKDDGVRFYSGPDPKDIFSEDEEEATEVAGDELETAAVEADELEEEAPKVEAKKTAKAAAAPKAKKSAAEELTDIL